MGGVDSAVAVTVVASLTGVALEEFDTLLLLSATASATWTTDEKVREYGNLPGVGADFGPNTPEYKAAAIYFQQKPTPKRMLIGRLTDPVAPQVDVGALSLKATQAYKFLLVGCQPDGTAIPETEIHFTSDGTPANDEIASGLQGYGAGLSLAGVTFTAPGSSGSKVCRVAVPAGGWLAVKLVGLDGKAYGPAAAGGLGLLSLATTATEPASTMAAQIQAILDTNSGWFVLGNPYQSKAVILANAAAVEALGNKMYDQVTSDTETITHVASGATDIAASLNGLNYQNTMLQYHSRADQFLDIGMMGRCLPISPGKGTFYYKVVKGVTADNLTTTHKANLKAKKCGWYSDMGGLSVTDEGKSVNGAFGDSIRNILYTVSRLQTDVFTALQSAEKIDHTDDGIVVLEGIVKRSLEARKKDRILASYTMDVPTEDQIDDATRRLGIIPNWNISGVVIVGIHRVEFNLLLAV